MKYRHFAKEAVLALIGGSIYVFIELVWRGYSHISMFILGGVCFVIIGLINELFPWDSWVALAIYHWSICSDDM